MAALVVPGAPVSVLLEHGLSEAVVDKLVERGVTTVEKLGAMTPEQLEEIPGVDPEMVEQIQQTVVAYYGQFEVTPPAAQTEAAAQTDGQTEAGVAVNEAAASEAAVNGDIAPAQEASAAQASVEPASGEPASGEPASPEQSVTIDNKELPAEGR